MRKTVITCAAIVFAASTLGCMSLSFGERKEVVSPPVPVPPLVPVPAPLSDDGPITQTGGQQIAPGDEVTIYYPMPFQSPPNLVISENSGGPSPTCYYLIDQKADCFRIRNATATTCRFPWTARGLKQIAPVPPVNTGAPVTLPASSNDNPSLLPPATH